MAGSAGSGSNPPQNTRSWPTSRSSITASSPSARPTTGPPPLRCWRPGSTAPTGTLGGPGEMDAKPFATPPEPPVAVELRALVQLAQGGDPTALPRIRQILDDH